MLQIEYRPLASLAPYANNPRTHSASQIRAIERSLSRFGWAVPMGIADGVLIYGHARRQAAINLQKRNTPIPGNDDPASGPVVDLSHLSAADRKAYQITDNQTALLAGWDADLLGVEMRELLGAGYDLSVTGFTELEIGRMTLEPVGDATPGSLLELAQITLPEPKHTVMAGEHWVLADRHHLLCVSVIEDWAVWRPLLKKGCLFIPYPGPFVPFGSRADEQMLLMVQPDAYAAGMLLDRYAEARGAAAVRRA